MANFLVTVEGVTTDVSVVVCGIPHAASLVSTFLLKGDGVHVRPTDLPVTHRNTYAAESYLSVSQMGLDFEIRPRAEP